jgi:hypothetical protein
MKTYILSFTQLLTNTALGGIGLTVFLFLLCFLIVHFFVLAKIGWKARQLTKNQTDPTPQKETPAPKEKEREPIYYIVERKRTRARPKTSYSEPKEFRFK